MSQLGANPYLLNIIPLFNIADPTNGMGTNGTLDATVSNLTSMVNTVNHTIAVNGIQQYNGTGIVITGEVDIVGDLAINGVPIGANVAGSNFITGTTLIMSTGNTGINLYSSTTTVDAPAIEFIAGGYSAFQIDSLGRALYQGDGVSSNVNRLWISSSILHADRAAVGLGGVATMSTMFDVWSGDAYFNDSIFVKNDVHCTTLYQVSDKRLKSNITPLTGALSTICELQGVHYDMGGKPTIGFIAQEVAAVVPEAATTMPGGLMAVDYSRIVPLLVEAVKELAAGLQRLQEE
jgi:hypothetical protein